MLFQNVVHASKTTPCHNEEASITSQNFGQVLIKYVIRFMTLSEPRIQYQEIFKQSCK
jgi:hypothetical protein